MSRLNKRKRQSVIEELTSSDTENNTVDTNVKTDTEPEPQIEDKVIKNKKTVSKKTEPKPGSNYVDLNSTMFDDSEFDSDSSRLSFEMAFKTIEQGHAKPKDRLNAVKLLRGAVCPATHKLLMHLSEDEDEAVRTESVFTLLEHRCDDIPFLTNLIKTNKDASLRLSALRRIYQVLNNEATPIIGHALINDECADVRKRAASMLGKIGINECVKFLSQALNDKHPEVRKSAVESFGVIGITGYPLSKVRLKRLRNDEYETVRKSAEKAIKRIDDLIRRDKLETINNE